MKLFLGSALALVMLSAMPASAQLAKPVKSDYHTARDTPAQLFEEFRGMWDNTNRVSIEKFETLTEPLTPAYQKKRDEAIAIRAKGQQVYTSDAQCIPAGMPRQMLNASFEVFVHPNSLTLMTAGGGIQVRNIWTDGRKPTPIDDLFETFSGESIGHWEGDTLVVHTQGLRPTNEFLYGVQGHYMTVDEKFTKIGPDLLQVETVVNDPVVFTTPWTYATVYKRDLTKTMTENNYCVAALDRQVDKSGKEVFDLTPPGQRLQGK
jgi:hypothetical protein